MSAALWVIIVGLGTLVVLAVLIGRIDGESQEAAWRRIALARREIAEAQRQLDDERERLYQEIDRVRCEVCPLRGGQYRPREGLTSE